MDAASPGTRNAVATPVWPWADICPYLRDASGTWRGVHPTGEHRCTAVSPPLPLRAETQRRLCLGAGHIECPTYIGARAARGRTLSDIAQVDVGEVDSAEASPGRRRACARTAPIVLERPGPTTVALSLLRDSAPQVGLVVLMALGAVALFLARFARP